MKKIVKRILLGVPIVIILIVLLFVGVLFFTPKPLFALMNLLPIEANLTKPKKFSLIENNTSIKKDILYSNHYPKSSLDIYLPKESKNKIPLILFIHGGGFFKGEKEMAKFFGPTLSNDEYAFISIDYDLAPNATIFDQAKQVNEALSFIVENANKYSFDTSNINLSGSSAGGFLALQLLSAYYDESYSEMLDIKRVENVSFKGLLLYSAVYDLSEFQTFEGNEVTKYLLAKIGWGLTGEKNWINDSKLRELLNLNNYINENFPPIFITDGNTNTFTEQAKLYAADLQKKSVSIETLFFEDNEKVGHGYQLNMDNKASQEGVKRSLEFLKEVNSDLD